MFRMSGLVLKARKLNSCVSPTRCYRMRTVPHTALTPFVSCGVIKMSCFQHAGFYIILLFVHLFQPKK